MNRLIRFFVSSLEYIKDLILFLVEIFREWLRFLLTVCLLLSLPYLSYVLFNLLSSDLTLAGRALTFTLDLIHTNPAPFTLMVIVLAYLTWLKVLDIRKKQERRAIKGDDITGRRSFVGERWSE